MCVFWDDMGTFSQELGQTMFAVINIYTKAAQYQGLQASSSFKLEKVGGATLGMVK
jgi:hypothetical protein